MHFSSRCYLFEKRQIILFMLLYKNKLMRLWIICEKPSPESYASKNIFYLLQLPTMYFLTLFDNQALRKSWIKKTNTNWYLFCCYGYCMATTINDQLLGAKHLTLERGQAIYRIKPLQAVLGSNNHNNNITITKNTPSPSNKHKESAILMVHGENLECYGLEKETISPLKYASLD